MLHVKIYYILQVSIIAIIEELEGTMRDFNEKTCCSLGMRGYLHEERYLSRDLQLGEGCEGINEEVLRCWERACNVQRSKIKPVCGKG